MVGNYTWDRETAADVLQGDWAVDDEEHLFRWGQIRSCLLPKHNGHPAGCIDYMIGSRSGNVWSQDTVRSQRQAIREGEEAGVAGVAGNHYWQAARSAAMEEGLGNMATLGSYRTA